MDSREQRIATLASTLKTSGIAKSDSQARMMAEEMIGVEEHVQRNFEEKHASAHEHLQTAKNLGAPRYTKVPEQKPESKPSVESSSRKIEPIALQGVTSKIIPSSTAHHEPVHHEYTDVDFGKKTLSQAFSNHDTHNAALESIKAQIQREDIIRDVDEIAGEIDAAVVEESESAAVDEPELEPESEPLVVDEPELESTPLTDEDQESLFSEVEKGDLEVEKGDSSIGKEDTDVVEDEALVEKETEEVKLDTEKLVDMMEEDGKLEEHTREITEKPKDVKPKEDYVENSIDLSNVFDFNKK